MSEQDFRSTGIEGMDRVIKGLRLGDNVVMQVGDMANFTPFVEPLLEAAMEQKADFVYIRFAQYQEPVITDPRVRVHTLKPEIGFEKFVLEILDLVEQEGPGTYYVFDCLSELAVDWYSDQMLGNFFMIVCPFLRQMDTIAYFGMIRNRHMQRTVENITKTAQVILEVYRNKDQLYVQPLKVMGRYSPTIFMLHSWEGRVFKPVTSSATLTEIMANLPQSWLEFSLHRPGVWRRTVMHAQETWAAVRSGKLTHREADDCFRRLLRMAVTRDDRYRQLAQRFFTLEDLIHILARMIGSGLIGGKTLGMLLARAMILKTKPELAEKLEAHDSFFIGSDVFYTYLVQNGCWDSRRDQQDPDTMLEELDDDQERCLLYGEFPQYLVNQFKEMLNYFGQSPIIVRSSSLLEDNYGNAFSGKYASYFCPNQGPLSERLDQFMDAVRQIYASALSRDALVYRKHRGLLDQEEQMALLVQRVSGTVHDGLFFPTVGGVGFSFNPFVWADDIDPKAGFLRLVCGLGTRAVDRLEDDYTRLVALNAPEKRIHTTAEQIRQYSQQHLDVLNLAENKSEAVSFREVVARAPNLSLEMIATRDQELMQRAARHGVKDAFPWVLTFNNLLNDTDFVPAMRTLLRTLETCYSNPVDTEFTVNFTEDGSYRINLLQCRPFQARVKAGRRLPQLAEGIGDESLILRSRGPIIGQSRALPIDRILYVVPSVYAKLNNSRRCSLARIVGKLNRQASKDEVIMIIGPGRWGTTTPSFGVPVSFQEIRAASVICELAVMHEGLIPDVSLGTHFFNDLVELDMLYLAVFPERDGFSFHEDRLRTLPNSLLDHLPDAGAWEEAIWVIDAANPATKHELSLHADSVQQQATCWLTSR